jgi:flagellar biosynthetic protein FlhB
MAEDQDRLQKTEEPTLRRLDEARRKGQVAHSREVNHVLILGAGTLFAGVLAAPLAGRLGDLLRPFLSAPHQLPTDPAGFAAMIVVFATKVGGMMLLPALLFVAAALAAGLIQNGWVVSAAPLVPKAERLSPLAGMKRLFSLRKLVEFLKGIAKIALVGAAATLIMWSAAPRMLATVSLEAGPLAAFLGSLSLRHGSV